MGVNQSAPTLVNPLAPSISHASQDTVTVYYDAAESTSQQVVLPIIRQVMDVFDRGMVDSPVLIQVENEPLQSQHLRSIDYLVPGILAMALMQLGIFAAASLVVDRQNRVLKRLGPLRCDVQRWWSARSSSG
ncbi:MAG: hypothetical protein JW753_03890 [Dehalococcoidia bacterium]|nr:hypothetical protein [Dehalococcoidia bacterium]